MPLIKNQTITLEIESISSDGNGVGRYDGQVVFVPYTAAGDVADVKIVKTTKSLAYGIIEKLITAGEGRITPDCPIFGTCGGCSFRHLSYEAELKAKTDFVKDALFRIGGLDLPILSILPSPDINHYRNKVQYPVASSIRGELIYGFYAGRSHRVVPCAECMLQPKLLNEIAAYTMQFMKTANIQAYDEASRSGLLRHIYLRQNTKGDVMLCLVCTSIALPQKEKFAKDIIAAYPQIETIVINVNSKNTNVILGSNNITIFGSGYLEDEICGVPVKLGTHSFFQVNRSAAEQLFIAAKKLADPKPDETVLDLYCGTGVIGLSMAKDCKNLIGVETVAAAVESAKESAKKMGLSNTRFIAADAAKAAETLAKEGTKIDVAILDPPRKGAGEATLNHLLQMQPKRIVMVSCNPATLARDLKHLAQNGYAVETVQPADLFPRTRHVETICLMTQKV